MEVKWRLKTVWKDPWWYVALLLFDFGPFLGTGSLPWWAILYIPAMTAFVFFMSILIRRNPL
jgi:hypothetical protein